MSFEEETKLQRPNRCQPLGVHFAASRDGHGHARLQNGHPAGSHHGGSVCSAHLTTHLVPTVRASCGDNVCVCVLTQMRGVCGVHGRQRRRPQGRQRRREWWSTGRWRTGTGPKVRFDGRFRFFAVTHGRRRRRVQLVAGRQGRCRMVEPFEPDDEQDHARDDRNDDVNQYFIDVN